MWSIIYSFCSGVCFAAAIVSIKHSEAGSSAFFSFAVVVCVIAAFAAEKMEVG